MSNQLLGPRMSGRVLPTALPLLRGTPEADDYLEHRAADGRRAFIAHRVLEDLAELERAAHPDETGGLLFGAYFVDGDSVCAIVNALVMPEPGEVIGTPTTVTITAAGSERMIERAWRRDPLLRAVGWGHTHPCFEAYFSGTDRDEQRRWREPASVGLVISGLAGPGTRHQVFLGPESTPAEPLHALPAAPVAPRPKPPRRRTSRAPVLALVLAGAITTAASAFALDAASDARQAEARAAQAARAADRAFSQAINAAVSARAAAEETRALRYPPDGPR